MILWVSLSMLLCKAWYNAAHNFAVLICRLCKRHALHFPDALGQYEHHLRHQRQPCDTSPQPSWGERLWLCRSV